MPKFDRQVTNEKSEAVQMEVEFNRNGTRITATNQETGEVKEITFDLVESANLYDLMSLVRPDYKPRQ